LIAWVKPRGAINGRIELTPFLLFALVALWSPPHFWSLVIYRRKEFQQAGLGPIPSGNIDTWTTIFSILLVTVSMLLVPAAGLGRIYLVSAAVLGITFLVSTWKLYQKDNSNSARFLHRYSIIYLIALFAAIAFDKLIR
jgi:heme o synthase